MESLQEMRRAEVVAANRENPVDPDDVDDVRRHIERWESSNSKTLTLAEYLGWSVQALQDWNRRNDKSVPEWRPGSDAMHWSPPPNSMGPFEKLCDDLASESARVHPESPERKVLQRVRGQLRNALREAERLRDEALVK